MTARAPIYLEKTRDPEVLLASARATLDRAVAVDRTDTGRTFRNIGIYALFSGGHDSLVTTYCASTHPAFLGVIHVDTGTGIPETQDFVRGTCARQGWPLHVVKNEVMTYEMLVVRYGFPGPSQHQNMYRYLKERPLEHFLAHSPAKEGKTDKFTLAAGVRSQESAKRMGYVEPVRYLRNVVWASAIHDWSATEVTRFVDAVGLQRNPVKDMLHISGECLCGCYADPMEREEIAMWYPHVDAALAAREAVVRAAAEHRPGNISIKPEHCSWGWGAAMKKSETPDDQMPLPLCFYCHAGRDSMEIVEDAS